MRRLIPALLLMPLLFCAVSAEDLTEKNYKQIRDSILPQPEEVEWRAIGWRNTLWDGVIDAQKEDKPVLLYAMNGHPFGCV
ncbi:MAG: hypothetical protein IT461_12865 [Planctomycetes bacterium]|nr:hypothetical protein [Planctomycetota bacterium]